MAIMSNEELFSDKQAITGSAASTNVIDFGQPGQWVHGDAPIVDDKGVSHIPLGIVVNEDFNTLTSLTVTLQADNDEAFGSPTDIYAETIALADLVAGKKNSVRMIPFNTTERYVRLNYTVTGANPTQGTITAGIMQLENPWGNR